MSNQKDLVIYYERLFLGFSKRRVEMVNLKGIGEKGNSYRSVIKDYNQLVLDNAINSTELAAVITYSIFCTLSSVNPSLIITIPIVYYTILVYKLELLSYEGYLDPIFIVFKNRKIFYGLVLWIFTYILFYYGKFALLVK